MIFFYTLTVQNVLKIKLGGGIWMREINSILAELISKLIKLPDKGISESDLIAFLYLVNILNLINRKKYLCNKCSDRN